MPHDPLRASSMSRRALGLQTAGLAATFALGGCGERAPAGGGAPRGNRWATGGTAAMAASYPDPPFEALDACPLLCAMTRGPCYAETLERRDVSEGLDGLPVRLVFRVVDPGCAPVVGAVVDLWHAAPGGRYSGDDAELLCTGGDEDALAARWFRGTQTTNAEGVAHFDTCFPGWYPGRTPHFHFEIRRDGREYVVSQLVFEQALVDEIFSAHPAYAHRGLPGTTRRTSSSPARSPSTSCRPVGSTTG